MKEVERPQYENISINVTRELLSERCKEVVTSDGCREEEGIVSQAGGEC